LESAICPTAMAAATARLRNIVRRSLLLEPSSLHFGHRPGANQRRVASRENDTVDFSLSLNSMPKANLLSTALALANLRPMSLPGKAVELLSEVDLFASLGQPELAGLEAIGKTQRHPPGKIIFRQGEKSDGLHIVLSGKLDCYLWDDLFKTERPLVTLKRGETFGEVGLLTDESRSAFVRAQEESETIFFEKTPFFDFLEQRPKILLEFARILAHRLVAATKDASIKVAHLAAYKITRELAQLLPLQVVLRQRVLPVEKRDNEVTVALVDPTDQVARNTVTQFLSRKKLNWVYVSAAEFDSFRDKKLFDLVNDAAAPIAPIPEEISYVSARTGTPIDATSEAARALDSFLSSAIAAGASDLHLEPGPQNVNIRARIDGRLVELAPAIPFSAFRPIVSRIKVLAEMDIAETRLPQDAVLRVRYGNRNVDLRISTVPAAHAEAVACRLFDPIQRMLDLDSLIVSDAVADAVQKLFRLPSGLLLVTGPTGSGKTTTLYAGLQMRQSEFPTNKIVTAEDPVEYELSGITQVQVNPGIGLTYERILRSLLRQDPEVILVGEIRDGASMEIALEAALTGHFVLSSLHTNDAFETVTRLRQRGAEPYTISSALRGIISQRLLPRLCTGCAEQTTLPEPLAVELQRSGIAEADNAPKGWKAKGCAHCKMSGYKGRVALYEVLVGTPALRAAIERGATIAELEKAAPPGSFVGMRRYARYILEKGLASAKDVLEVLPPQPAIARL
jgi:type II secretory ATPase GspE/PulE/Tfp pilus assembly ATPase PilB-like protein